MVLSQDPHLFEKIWYNLYNGHTNNYTHSILILQVLHVENDCLSYIYINTKITTTTATVTCEPGFIHGVCGDPSLLSSLSLSTIVPIFVNTDVLTLKFDKGCNTSVIMNNFARNNDIIHYTKCEQKKESEANQCIAGLRNLFLSSFCQCLCNNGRNREKINFCWNIDGNLFIFMFNWCNCFNIICIW